MIIRQWFAIACGVAFIAGAAVAAAEDRSSAASSDLDGLVKVKSKRFDEVSLRPGADFRGYTKVMLDPAQVTFARTWMKDMNANQIALLHRTTVEDADRIVEKVRTGFGDVFANVFKSAGYEIVAAPGADVLRLSLRLIDLYINAPETVTLALPTRVYTLAAGKATLVLEVRDATTGALLGRVVDRGTAGDRGSSRSSLMLTGPVTNRFNFENLFDVWARDFVKSLEESKAQPPVAANVPTQH
jgi:hypothetical protein